MIAAEELMSNDIIKVKDATGTHPVRIIATDIAFMSIIRGAYLDRECEDTGWFSQDLASPIPLTPEHLEANGWKYTNDHTLKGAQTYVKDVTHSGFEYRLTFKFEPWGYFSVKSFDEGWHTLFETKILPEYIHQFQHFLKDVGLTDLAKNFKI